MTLKTVRDYLLTQSAVTAIVSDRIFINIIPQDTPTPSLALTIVDEVPINSLCGYSDLRKARVQVDCFARDTAAAGGYQNVNTLAEAVESAMRDKQVLNSISLARRDSYDVDTQEHRCSLDFSTWRQT